MPRILAAALAGVLLLTGCTAKPAPTPTVSPTPTLTPAQARTSMPEQATSVVDGATAADLALATSRALYQHAPAVVVAGVDDGAGQNDAIPTARDLGVPLLLTPNDPAGATALRAELDRLGTKTIVTVGEAASRWARPDQPVGAASASPAAAPTATPSALPYEIVERPGDGQLPTVVKSVPLTDLLVLALDKPVSRAAVATAQAAGARVVTMANPDPRMADDVIKALSGQPTDRVLALGGDFGPAERLRRRMDVAATGVLLPGGGQVLFPGRRMVALYGHPGDSILGSLGEQPLAAAIARARKVADAYRPLVGGETVVPTFEIITTIASASAGADGDYSLESSIDKIKPWVDAAREAGMYVMLDLQPGRTDFLTQAKRYEPLLKQPHVGLALDPEWRLGPNERHMVQIGSVSAAEVNTVVTWLAELTRANKLPQKLLMLHQFRLDMITERSTVDTSHDELRILIHADGFGSPGQKFNTWRAMHLNPPANVAWGWKNFYDEDQPTFTPTQTVAVNPSPVFVSYQ